MTTHSLANEGDRRPRARHGNRNELLQLTWFHYWLLISILGGMLALVVLVIFAHLSPL